MQEMAFKSLKEKRVALRIQYFMPGQSEYLVLSPSTTQPTECFSSHPKLTEKLSSHQVQELITMNSQGQKSNIFLRSSPQCVEAGRPHPLSA